MPEQHEAVVADFGPCEHWPYRPSCVVKRRYWTVAEAEAEAERPVDG